MLQASQLALFDVGHASFELMPRDTKGTAKGAEEAALDVIEQGAKLILGPVFSHSVSSVKSIARRANVNVVGFSTDWTLAGGNVFIMGFMPFDQIQRLGQYLAFRNPGRLGIFAPGTDYGRVVASSFKTVAQHYDLGPPEATFFSRDSRNLTPEIRSFTRFDEREAAKEMLEAALVENPEDAMIETLMADIELPYDAVLLPVGGQTALSISNLLSHFDMPPSRVQRLGTGLFDDDGLATEKSMDGAWFAAPSPKLRKPFEKRYRDLYGQAPQRLSTLAYDATALAAVLAHQGIQAQGIPDFSRRAITNPNGFSGIDGIFRFRSNGAVERGLAILEYKHGKIVILEDAPTTFQKPL